MCRYINLRSGMRITSSAGGCYERDRQSGLTGQARQQQRRSERNDWRSDINGKVVWHFWRRWK
jgi:hypothetical protein